MTAFHQQVDTFIEEVRDTHKNIKESIQKMEESNMMMRQEHEKKLKIAYCIGGGALGLSIINIVLQALGVI